MNTACDKSDTPSPSPGRSILLAMSWYDHRVHRGISKFARERGWRVDARMANSTEMAWGWQGDGVITKLGCSTLDVEIRDFVLGLGCPAVDMSVFGPEHGLPAIEFDPVEIGRLAAAHFIERGFRCFAWYPALDLPPIRQRRTGFEAALAEVGFTATPIVPTESTSSNWESSERALGEQLGSLEAPVGVLCFNDEWGSRVIRACERAGCRVPEDVAVLGVDDNELVCEHLSVPLSSVGLDLELWGATAAARLGDQMDHPEKAKSREPTLELFAPRHVITRQSTDILAVAHPDVAAAARFIAERFADRITAQDVIDRSRLSGSGLKQAFRTHLRRSITDEIQRVRCEAVRRLLVETDWTLDRIAMEVGLGDVRNLHRLFDRFERESPTVYRKQRQGTGRIGRAALDRGGDVG